MKGYKSNSPYRNRPYNIINSNIITMKGVSKPLTLIPIIGGVPHYDKKVVAKPGDDDIKFDDNVESVMELPYAQGGTYLNPYLQKPYGIDNAIKGVSPINNEISVNGIQQQAINNIAPLNGIDPQLNTINNLNIDAKYGYGKTGSFADTLAFNEKIAQTDPDLAQKMAANDTKMKVEMTKVNNPFRGAANPYGGWNMENAATMLGAFAQNKNVLGMVGAAGKLGLMGARNFMQGKGAMKLYNEGRDEYEAKLEEEERRQGFNWSNLNSYQKGGNVSKMATGHFIEGNDNHSQPNVEVEAKEYLQTPDGNTMQVLGDRHSDGGELLNLPEGTRVISDYLKIGSKLASFFKKEYKLNVTSGSKFATVMTQYKNKIGLTELLEEEEKLIEKAMKQEDVELEGTKEINLQVITKKIQELQSRKTELEKKFQVFTNLVFDKQEATKEPGGYNYKKQEGGAVEQVPTEQQSSSPSNINLEEIVMMYAQITGQDPAEIVNQLQQIQDEQQLEQIVQEMITTVEQSQNGGEQQTMQKGGSVQYMQGGGKKSQNNRPLSKEELTSIMTNFDIDPTSESGKVLMEELKRVYDTEGFKKSGFYDVLRRHSPIKNLPKHYNDFKNSRFKTMRFDDVDIFEQLDRDYSEPVVTVKSVQENSTPASSANKQYYTGTFNPNEFLTFRDTQYRESPNGDYKDIDKQAERARAIWPMWTDVRDEDLKDQVSQDALASRGQKAVGQYSPKLRDHFSKTTAATQQGLQTGLNNGLFSKEELSKLGLKFNGDNVNIGSWGALPPENIAKIQDYIQTQLNEKPELANEYISKNFNDDRWYYRAPDIRGVKFKDQNELDNFIKDYSLVDDVNGNKIYYSNKNGLYFTPLLDKSTTEEPEKQLEEQVGEKPSTEVENLPNKNLNSPSLPLSAPVPTRLAPDIHMPGLRTIGHVQANAIRMSPEDTIRELNRQTKTASDLAYQNNPYTAAGTQANLQAQALSATNQAYTNAAIQNAQDERNVENLNEDRIMKREAYNIGKMDNYERESQAALDNYATSWRNLLDAKYNDQVNSWNLQNEQNMFNAINPNIKIGSMGQIYQTDETPQFFIHNGERWFRDPKTGVTQKVKQVTDSQGNIVKTETTSSDKVPKVKTGKKGGLLLTSGIKKYFK